MQTIPTTPKRKSKQTKQPPKPNKLTNNKSGKPKTPLPLFNQYVIVANKKGIKNKVAKSKKG